jgi:hypothetical protein
LGYKVELERPESGREPSCWKSLSILILPSLQVFIERNIDDLETSMRIKSNTAMDKFVPRHPYVVHWNQGNKLKPQNFLNRDAQDRSRIDQSFCPILHKEISKNRGVNGPSQGLHLQIALAKAQSMKR